MNVSAYFLACLGRTKNSHDWDLGFLGEIFRVDVVAKSRVIFGGRRLVEVDAVQSNLEHFHDDRGAS